MTNKEIKRLLDRIIMEQKKYSYSYHSTFVDNIPYPNMEPNPFLFGPFLFPPYWNFEGIRSKCHKTNIRDDLTTSEKMIVYRFVTQLESSYED